VDSAAHCCAGAVSNLLYFILCAACRVRTTVLGSRTQLCLHDKVSKMAGQAANFTCRALVAHKQCRW
jgi:chemotaxis receptor (MCP) glutamine deamidase CheD